MIELNVTIRNMNENGNIACSIRCDIVTYTQYIYMYSLKVLQLYSLYAITHALFFFSLLYHNFLCVDVYVTHTGRKSRNISCCIILSARGAVPGWFIQ